MTDTANTAHNLMEFYSSYISESSKGVREIHEASEIDFNTDLPEKIVNESFKINRHFKSHTLTAFDGIHGIIVLYSLKPPSGFRLDKKDLNFLSKIKGFRWVDFSDRQTMSIGFTHK